MQPCECRKREGRERFGQEHQAPAFHPQRVIQIEKQPGNRRADDLGHRDGCDGDGEDRCTVPLGCPLAQIEHRARRKAAFGETDQHAQAIQLPFGGDHRHRAGRQPPRGGYRREPAAHPDGLVQQHAGIFRQHVAHEQDAGAKAVLGARQAEGAVHIEGGKPHVRAVYRAHQHIERRRDDQMQQHLATHRSFNGRHALRFVVLFHAFSPFYRRHRCP
jgi:hypothetical protein